MKIITSKNSAFDQLKDIDICENDKIFRIVFGGNGDLYWQLIHKNKRLETDEFNITKENYFIYQLFEQLFNSLKNVPIFNLNELELERCESDEERKEIVDRTKQYNEELKRTDSYKQLYQDKKITWISDDASDDIDCNKVIISKENEMFKIIFSLKEKQFFIYNSIRFRNSGSKYEPFNRIFMDMYHQLQSYYPEYHQIHLEEYAYQKKLTLN